MAMKIVVAECTVCGSCEFVCPTSSISMKGDTYVINPSTCKECEGFFDSPRCVAECPADCIVPA